MINAIIIIIIIATVTIIADITFKNFSKFSVNIIYISHNHIISLHMNVQDDDEGTDNDSMNDNDFEYNEEDDNDPLLGRTKVMVRK